MIAFVPRDNDVQRAEINRKTVIEWNPEGQTGRRLPGPGQGHRQNQMFVIPKPWPSKNWNSCCWTTG
jgi:nitrogenase iron protein NifH